MAFSAVFVDSFSAVNEVFVCAKVSSDTETPTEANAVGDIELLFTFFLTNKL